MSGRIRTVKPEWLEDEHLAMASSDARVLSIALIVLADDHGRGRANVTMLAGRVFPGLANPREALANALDSLATCRFVRLYEIDGQSYFEIRNWTKHQRVDRPGKPHVPAPPAESLDNKNSREYSRESRESLAKVPDTLATDLRPTTGTNDQDQETRARRAAKPKPDPMSDPDVSRLIGVYRTVHALGDRWSPETKEGRHTRAEHILRALRGLSGDVLTPSEVEAAIRGNAADDWHRSVGKHEISYVLRSDKVRGFIGGTGQAKRRGPAEPTPHSVFAAMTEADDGF